MTQGIQTYTHTCYVCRSTEPRHFGWISFGRGYFCGLACHYIYHRNRQFVSGLGRHDLA